jgi:hypothetical protein
MRLVLISDFSSYAVKEDATVLSARGYDVVTYFDLHHPCYAANGGRPADAHGAHANLVLELMERSLIAVHPDCEPFLLQQVAAVCRFIGRKLIRMDQLPHWAPAKNDRSWLGPLPCLAAFTPEEEERRICTRASTAPVSAKRGRMATAYSRLLSRINRLDAWIGDGLKNLMTREQQRLKRYAEPNVLSTTG